MKNTGNITHSVITVGNKNVVTVNTEANSYEWDKLKEDFFKLIKQLPQNTKELECSQKAIEHVIGKNEKDLKKLIKNHVIPFTSNLFSNTASVFLVEFIKQMIG